MAMFVFLEHMAFLICYLVSFSEVTLSVKLCFGRVEINDLELPRPIYTGLVPRGREQWGYVFTGRSDTTAKPGDFHGGTKKYGENK